MLAVEVSNTQHIGCTDRTMAAEVILKDRTMTAYKNRETELSAEALPRGCNKVYNIANDRDIEAQKRAIMEVSMSPEIRTRFTNHCLERSLVIPSFCAVREFEKVCNPNARRPRCAV